ncbi:MAG TPA: hypothetical protein VFR03_12845 [Thermoanaerobaculia bacterium]|nr:hypothetical protein [Thermoanaerobaculia bacterium]
MKKRMKKLQLSRETLRALTDMQASGAAAVQQQAAGNLSISPCTNVISDCYACTGKLDTCPDPTVVVA